VLDGVSHVDPVAPDAGLGEGAVEEPARRADEGLSLDVLAVARLLADEQETGFRRPLAEDGLSGAQVEITAFTARRRRLQVVQGEAWRQELGGRALDGGLFDDEALLAEAYASIVNTSASNPHLRRLWRDNLR
jgi:hypothetical protein